MLSIQVGHRLFMLPFNQIKMTKYLFPTDPAPWRQVGQLRPPAVPLRRHPPRIQHRAELRHGQGSDRAVGLQVPQGGPGDAGHLLAEPPLDAAVRLQVRVLHMRKAVRGKQRGITFVQFMCLVRIP